MLLASRRGLEGKTEDELRKMADAMEAIVEDEAKKGRRISMAALQGLFIRSSASEAARDIRTLFVSKEPVS